MNKSTDRKAKGGEAKIRYRLILLAVPVAILLVALFLYARDGSGTASVNSGDSYAPRAAIGDLATPRGVATDRAGNIYVSDSGASQVRFYDVDANLKFAFSEFVDHNDTRNFGSPYGIAVDDARGLVYVADDSKIVVLDQAGDFKYYLSPPAAVRQSSGADAYRPSDVAVGSNRVFVTRQDGIDVFSADDGSYLEHWGRQGTAVGDYDYPNGIAVDPADGNIYVVDTNNWRLVALTPGGRVRWTVGGQDNGRVSSPFQAPRSVAVGPDGLVYVSDMPDRIVVLDPHGALVSILGGRGSGDGQLNFPEGLAVTGDNRLLIADRENNRVQVWQLATPAAPAGADVDKFRKATRNT
ncbi:MAG: SMP-30/gluconolactonase/LRE family protein [Thermoleophilia bacterium]